MGCNNVVPRSTASGVASQYKFLIEAVKDKYPAAVMYLSAIIPKPCERSASFLIQFINELSTIIVARIFLATYKRFRAGQSINSALFSRSDLLHNNGAGVSQMGSFLWEWTDTWWVGALMFQEGWRWLHDRFD